MTRNGSQGNPSSLALVVTPDVVSQPSLSLSALIAMSVTDCIAQLIFIGRECTRFFLAGAVVVVVVAVVVVVVVAINDCGPAWYTDHLSRWSPPPAWTRTIIYERRRVRSISFISIIYRIRYVEYSFRNITTRKSGVRLKRWRLERSEICELAVINLPTCEVERSLDYALWW